MKVTIFSTTTCTYCKQLKIWLVSKGVDHQEYLVDKNPYAAQVMMQMSKQQSVPFTSIEHDDGSIEGIVGFDRPKFQKALGVS